MGLEVRRKFCRQKQYMSRYNSISKENQVIRENIVPQNNLFATHQKVLGVDYPSINVPVGVHGDWAEKSQKTDLHARVQIKKLTKELEAVKKENEEYAKQAKYF